MTIWAALCLVLFLITFFTTKERIQPIVETKSSPKEDFVDLLKNGPWIALVCYTVFNFGMLTLRGGAHFNYYHHYVDKAAIAALRCGSASRAVERVSTMVCGSSSSARTNSQSWSSAVPGPWQALSSSASRRRQKSSMRVCSISPLPSK